MIYRLAKSSNSGLEWGDLLILFNRNNCSLSLSWCVKVSIICESVAVQFLTFVPQKELSFLDDNEKFVSANFGNVPPFLVGATNTFSELIHPLVKLPNCVLKFYNFSEALGSFGFLSLREAGTGFVVVLPLPLVFDPPLYILHFTIPTSFHREATQLL